MEQIVIITCLVLTILNSAEGSPHFFPSPIIIRENGIIDVPEGRLGWIKQAKDYAEESRMNIKKMYSNDSICSVLRDHAVSYEELKVLKMVQLCTFNNRENNLDTCFNIVYLQFSTNIDIIKSPVNCNIENWCLLWNIFKSQYWRIWGGCFHSDPIDAIDISSRCSFMDSVAETARTYLNLKNKRSDKRNPCEVLSQQKIIDASRAAWDQYEICRDTNLQNVKSDFYDDVIGRNCSTWELIEKKTAEVGLCMKIHLSIWQKSIRQAKTQMDNNCKKCL